MNSTVLKNHNVLTTVYVDSVKNTEILNQCFYSISKQIKPTDLLVLYSDLNEEDLETLKQYLTEPEITVRSKDKESGEIKEEIFKSENPINFSLVKTDSDNFPKLFNDGFNAAIKNDYKFYCFIESEDILSVAWLDCAETYSKENDDLSIFLPIIRNTVNGIFNNFMNEAPWAEGMAEEAGRIDINLLMRFNCATPLGAIFKVDSVKEYSQYDEEADRYLPFKESMKLSHYYEFFLRMIYNDLKAITIPRIGYELRYSNKDSFSHTSCKIPSNLTLIPQEKGGMTQPEGQFWMELAKKEYFFDEDRKKEYAPKEN